MKQVNLRHVRTEEQAALYERIRASGRCSFCEDFCRGKKPTFHPNPVIKKTRYWALTEGFPKYEGAKKHFLIVSRFLDAKGEHALFPNIPPEAGAEFWELVVWAVKRYRLPGGAFFCRFGDTDYTGASVSHLHAHLIFGGEKDGDPLRVKIGYTKK